MAVVACHSSRSALHDDYGLDCVGDHAPFVDSTKIATGRFFVPSPLDLSILVLALMVPVSLYATPDLASSLPKVSGLIYGMGVFYAVEAATGQTARSLRWGVLVLLGSGSAVAVLGLFSADWNQKLPLISSVTQLLPQRLVRFPGSAAGIHANELAGVLLWILPLGLSLSGYCLLELWWKRKEPGSGRRLMFCGALWLGTVLMFGVLLLSQSRSALLALAVALFFLVVVALRHRHWFVALLILLTVLSLVALFSFGPETLLVQLVDPVGGAEPVGTALSTVTFDLRQEIWQRALFAISDFPLTGIGMNSFRSIVALLYPFLSASLDIDIAHAHNHLLQTALDLGLPGLIAYLAIWLGAGGVLWQSWRRSNAGWSRAMVAGFAAVLLAYSIFGLTDTVALGAKPGFVFWVLLGLIVGLHRLMPGPSASARSTEQIPGEGELAGHQQ